MGEREEESEGERDRERERERARERESERDRDRGGINERGLGQTRDERGRKEREGRMMEGKWN